MAQHRSPDAVRPDEEATHLSPSALDHELSTSPGLTEQPSGRKAAIVAVAVLGAAFYGLNNAALPPPATSTASQTPTQSASKADQAPNSETGMTTGAAMSRPRTPQAPANAAPDPAPSTTR